MDETLVKQEHIASLEALLFINGEPISFGAIEKALSLTTQEVVATVDALSTALAADARGISILSDGRKIQFVTKPHFSHILEDFAKQQLTEELTPAALEVLAIITYCAPIGKGEIEHMRGVNSSITLRNLLLRGLIEKNPHPEQKGLFEYTPSFELLQHLGVSRVEELPEFEKFKALYTQALSGDTHSDLESAVASVDDAG